MKKLVTLILLLVHVQVYAINPGQFLFAPLPETPASNLIWDEINMGWDVYNFTPQVRTFTVRNTGPITSNAITVTLTVGNEAFTISSDSCSGVLLLPGGSCTIDMDYNGFQNVPDPFILKATDGSSTTQEMRMHLCPDC